MQHASVIVCLTAKHFPPIFFLALNASLPRCPIILCFSAETLFGATPPSSVGGLPRSKISFLHSKWAASTDKNTLSGYSRIPEGPPYLAKTRMSSAQLRRAELNNSRKPRRVLLVFPPGFRMQSNKGETSLLLSKDSHSPQISRRG